MEFISPFSNSTLKLQLLFPFPLDLLRGLRGLRKMRSMRFFICVFAIGVHMLSRAGDPVWVRIAASDSRAEARQAADFVCTGSNDEVTIQKAIDVCRDTDRHLFFFSGLYNLDSVRDFGDGGPKAAICIRNMHREFAMVGESRKTANQSKGKKMDGIVLYLRPEALPTPSALQKLKGKGEGGEKVKGKGERSTKEGLISSVQPPTSNLNLNLQPQPVPLFPLSPQTPQTSQTPSRLTSCAANGRRAES